MTDAEKFKTLANSKLWIFLPVLIAGVLCFIHFTRLTLNSTSEGDFGRDLYAFYLTFKGQLPYIQFDWVYGLFTPYVYATMFKIFGVSVLTAVSVYYVIYVFCIVLVFVIVRSFYNNLVACLSTLLFMSYYGFFIYNFNHVFGTFTLLVILFLLKLFLETKKDKWLFSLGICCFILTSIKLSMGLFLTLTIYFFLAVFLIRDKQSVKNLLISFGSYLILSCILYLPFIIAIPSEYLLNNFPVTQKYLTSSRVSIFENMFKLETSTFTIPVVLHQTLYKIHTYTSLNLWYFVSILGGFILLLVTTIKKMKLKNSYYILILLVLAFVAAHEFYKIGTYYSLKYWVLPIIVIVLPVMLTNTYNLFSQNKGVKISILLITALIVLTILTKLYISFLHCEHKQYYCSLPRVKMSFTNPYWLSMFNTAIKFIDTHTKKDEMILCIPENTLYNFASDRDQPTRVNSFAKIANVDLAHQKKIMKNMEKEHVRFVLISDKGIDPKYGFGFFGKTHCQQLYKYIAKNYGNVTAITVGASGPVLSPIYIYQRTSAFKQ